MYPEKKYLEAFHTLNLSLFATKEEVERQRDLLVKAYSVIDGIDFKAKIEEIKAAAYLLVTEYFVVG